MREYKDFRLKYREQDPRDVFCDFSVVTQSVAGWEYPYEKLAEIAQPENWGSTRDEFKSRYPQQAYPILMNHLKYTFLRLQGLNLIEYTGDSTKACLNTGLLTNNEEQSIQITFHRNEKAELCNKPDCTLFGFAKSYDVRKSGNVAILPEPAWYYEDPTNLFFELRHGFWPFSCPPSTVCNETSRGGGFACHHICESMFRNNTKGFRTDWHVSCCSFADFLVFPSFRYACALTIMSLLRSCIVSSIPAAPLSSKGPAVFCHPSPPSWMSRCGYWLLLKISYYENRKKEVVECQLVTTS